MAGALTCLGAGHDTRRRGGRAPCSRYTDPCHAAARAGGGSEHNTGVALLTVGLALGLAIAIWVAWAFNHLVRLRNQMRNAWADIDVQLARRHDLVPQLVASVKGYASHEKTALETVTSLRARAMTLSSPAQLGSVESELERALGRVMVLGEAYPDLKASENFLQLQRDLVEVEDHLQYARRFYNGSVRDYHNAIQRFPDLAVARAGGFAEAEFFQAGDDERAPVRVEVSG